MILMLMSLCFLHVYGAHPDDVDVHGKSGKTGTLKLTPASHDQLPEKITRARQSVYVASLEDLNAETTGHCAELASKKLLDALMLTKTPAEKLEILLDALRLKSLKEDIFSSIDTLSSCDAQKKKKKGIVSRQVTECFASLDNNREFAINTVLVPSHSRFYEGQLLQNWSLVQSVVKLFLQD